MSAVILIYPSLRGPRIMLDESSIAELAEPEGIKKEYLTTL
jgi:hypothetical protein